MFDLNCPVDLDHPDNDGLLLSLLNLEGYAGGGSWWNATGQGNSGTLVNGPTWVDRGLSFTNAGANSLTVPAMPGLPTGGMPRLVAFWLFQSARPVGDSALFIYGSGSAIWGVLQSNLGSIYLFTDGGSNNVTLSASEAVQLDIWTRFVFGSNGTAWRFYKDGKLVKNGTFSINTASSAITIGRRNATSDAIIGDLAFYGVAPTDDWAARDYEWACRPYSEDQRLRRLTGTLYGFLAQSAPTSYTLSADPGTYSLAGQSTSLLANRSLTADPSTYSLTGRPADLLAARRVAADAAAFMLAGQGAGLLASRVLTGGSASYTAAGQDATILAARRISGGVGSYTITGQNATLVATTVSTAAYLPGFVLGLGLG